MFYKEERLAVLIDGFNTFQAFRALGVDPDFRKIRTEFSRRGQLLRCYYFTTLWDTEDHTPLRPLADFLTYNGYTVIAKNAKEFTESDGRKRIKGSVDIELVIEAIKIAELVDHIVLFSGNGDFAPLVRRLQDMGKRVTIVSCAQTESFYVADEMRRACDDFIELADLAESVRRTAPPSSRQREHAN